MKITKELEERINNCLLNEAIKDKEAREKEVYKRLTELNEEVQNDPIYQRIKSDAKELIDKYGNRYLEIYNLATLSNKKNFNEILDQGYFYEYGLEIILKKLAKTDTFNLDRHDIYTKNHNKKMRDLIIKLQYAENKAEMKEILKEYNIEI